MVEEDLKSHLQNDTGVAAIIGMAGYSRTFDHVARQSVAYPFLVIEEEGGQSSNVLSGPTNLARADFIIWSLGKTVEESVSLWNAVRESINGFGPAVMGSTYVHSILVDGGWRDRGFFLPQENSQSQVYYTSSRFDVWHNLTPIEQGP